MTAKHRLIILAIFINLGIIVAAVVLLRQRDPTGLETGDTEVTVGAETEQVPVASSATPTIPEKEEAVLNAIAQTNMNTTSAEECDLLLQQLPWCGIVSDVRHVSQEEWESLFPRAEFYLVRRKIVSRHRPERQNLLVVKQDDQTLSTLNQDEPTLFALSPDPAPVFAQLMETNGVTITAENRELVGRSLALMYLPNYLEGEIEFDDWRPGSWPAPGLKDYNYAVRVQTDVEAWQFSWYFRFDEGALLTAQGRVSLAEPIGQRDDALFPPPQDRLTYEER